MPLAGLVSVAVTPASQTVVMPPGGMTTATCSAQGTFNNGPPRDITANVNWTSSSNNVAVVAGVATVRGAGTFTITAAAGQVSGTATVIGRIEGAVMAPGFPATDQAALDGPATPGPATIRYPLDKALFPANWGPVTVQVDRTDQTSARIAMSGPGVDIKYYGLCETGAGIQTGCHVTLPTSLTTALAPASEAGDLAMTARLAGAGGVVEGAPVNVAWAPVKLTGGLYYWTTVGVVGTAIYRYNFEGDATRPQEVFSELDVQAQTPDRQRRCIGCHAITPDGKKMALTMNGSYPSNYMMVDIGTKTVSTFQTPPDNTGYATETAFAPDGSRMVNMYRGKFSLRSVETVPMDLGAVLPSVTENKTDGFWSSDGKLFAFATFDPTSLVLPLAAEPNRNNSDTKTGAQIQIADSDGMTISDSPRVLVPRAAGVTSYYPSISDDNVAVVFNQSDCQGPPGVTGYGQGACDGYDDLSATLNVVLAAGSPVTPLTRANGSPTSGNSWPRWSPDHGTFRGAKLYWVAFSSRRPYGLQVNQAGTAQSKPQLWFAAVSAMGDFATDSSFAAIWLPGQNLDQALPNGNHVPNWVKQVVTIIQ